MSDPPIEIPGSSEWGKLEDDNNELRTQLACACDLLNTWIRETGGLPECEQPFKELGLRRSIDDLWSKLSVRINAAAHYDTLRESIEKLRDEYDFRSCRYNQITQAEFDGDTMCAAMHRVKEQDFMEVVDRLTRILEETK